MRSKELSIVNFDAPYTDARAIGSIAAHGAAVCQNELPAFQVDVGDDRHLSGSLAVRAILEDVVNDEFGDTFARHGYPPFKFVSEAMRAPHFVAASHAKVKPLRPHLDSEQIGLAIHKEYPGEPTPVAFGYVHGRVPLPTQESYVPNGKGLRPYVQQAYEGQTSVGRLSIFSQGFALGGMKPSVHYFNRVPNQTVGGRWRRFFMNDPALKDFSRIPNYDRFVAMRQATSVYLDYRQWELLQNELAQADVSVCEQRREELQTMAADHLREHPGKQYTYWEVKATDRPGITISSYGVSGGGYSTQEIDDLLLYSVANS